MSGPVVAALHGQALDAALELATERPARSAGATGSTRAGRTIMRPLTHSRGMAPRHGSAGTPRRDRAFVPFDGVRHSLSWTLRLAETWWARAAGALAVEQAAHAHLDALVRYARERSPLYREAYQGIADGAIELARLPVMTRSALMARFDDWVTDRHVRRLDVARFIADRGHIGGRYLGRYVIWKSSGTSGEQGLYVQDDEALAIYDALIAVQLTRGDLAARSLSGVIRRGGRAALIAATGDHFASIASWERMCRAAPGLDARGFSILKPLPKLVDELNAFSPAYIASYPTMLAVLAAERSAGPLVIEPELVWSGGEYLSPASQAALERAFGCPVVNEYGASECLSIAFGCRAGWLHVNADWVVLEPVDADLRPTPPGQVSHGVLITNLANRIQPIIRYDLGDAVVAMQGMCECGSPLPAIRVHGRCDDIVRLRGTMGRPLRLPPLALTTVVEENAGVHRFQIVQRTPECLALRLDPSETGEDARAVFGRAARALRVYLKAQGAGAVRIEADAEPPQRDPKSGKLRQVLAGAGDGG